MPSEFPEDQEPSQDEIEALLEAREVTLSFISVRQEELRVRQAELEVQKNQDDKASLYSLEALRYKAAHDERVVITWHKLSNTRLLLLGIAFLVFVAFAVYCIETDNISFVHEVLKYAGGAVAGLSAGYMWGFRKASTEAVRSESDE